MEVVREVIEDELNLTIPIAGLAKDNRHRTSELLFGFPPQTIGIKQQSPLFRLLTQIQDEVHRFAISSIVINVANAGSIGIRQYQRDWRKDKNSTSERI